MMAQKNILSKRGFRKTSTAIARFRGSEIIVNDKKINEYFKDERLISMAMRSVKIAGAQGIFISVHGGGLSAQAQATQHAIARLLSNDNDELKTNFKKQGLLVGDTRQVERKKAGRIKARKGYVFRRR